MIRSIGVDLHKTNFTVCYYNDKTGNNELKTYKMNKIGLEVFKKTLKKSYKVAVEATGNTKYFIDQIEGLVKEVKVINPSQFKIISHSIKKTDENDALIIAKYLSKDLIPEVRMKNKEDSQISSLLNTRDKLIKLNSLLKNKIHNILNANGIVTQKESFSSEKSLLSILKLDLDDNCIFELGIIVNEIMNLNKSIEKINERLKDKGKGMKGHENLTSIKGIGNLTATILINKIGDINDFKNEKNLSSYFGIVPRVHASNETVHHGRITKMGDKLARTALVQSTFIAIRYNDYLRNFYKKLKAKKGSGKAIIATARKFLGIIYKTLKYNWIFEDFTKFKLATN